MAKVSTKEKTTIYLNPKVKKGVQYYALRDDKSLSEIIDAQLIEFLEDMEDIADIDKIMAEGGEFIPFEDVVKELGLDLDEIRRDAQAERRKTAKKIT